MTGKTAANGIAALGNQSDPIIVGAWQRVARSRVAARSLVAPPTHPCDALPALPSCLFAGEPATPAVHSTTNKASGQAATANITLDLPTPDVALGYVFSLLYYPPNAAAVPVKDAAGSSNIAVPRSSSQLTVVDDKLVLTLGLNTLKCGTSACGDGRYQLTAFKAASYWKAAIAGAPRVALSNTEIAAPATWKATTGGAEQMAASLSSPTDVTFYIGEVGCNRRPLF